MDKLLKYLNSLEKDARSAFCGSCDTSEGYIRKAVSTKQRLGADLCILLERESGGAVRCEDLRPDADWAFIRASSPAPKRTRRSVPPP